MLIPANILHAKIHVLQKEAIANHHYLLLLQYFDSCLTEALVCEEHALLGIALTFDSGERLPSSGLICACSSPCKMRFAGWQMSTATCQGVPLHKSVLQNYLLQLLTCLAPVDA